MQTRTKTAIFVVIIIGFGGFYYWNGIYKDNQENIQQTESDIYAHKGAVESQDFNDAMKKAQSAFGKGEYDEAGFFYKEALIFEKSDKAYLGLSQTWAAQNEWEKAILAVGEAVAKNPLVPDYRKWQLTLLDDKTDAPFADLRKLYDEAIPNIDPRARVDLTTHFARIAEANGEKDEAIILWETAKELNPDAVNIYQGEIDRIKTE